MLPSTGIILKLILHLFHDIFSSRFKRNNIKIRIINVVIISIIKIRMIKLIKILTKVTISITIQL